MTRSAVKRLTLQALLETRSAMDLRRILMRRAAVLRELEREPDGLGAIQNVFVYLCRVRDTEEFRRVDLRSLGLDKAIEAENYLINLGHDRGREQGREQGREEGREQGKQELSLQLLRRRFSRLPAAVVERVEAADAASVARWSERLFEAGSVEAVFVD